MDSKVILVTGAFGTLGRAIVEAAASQGAKVVAVDFAQVPGDETRAVQMLGGVDLADENQAREVIAQAIAGFGRLDAVLNAVGGFVWTPTAEAGPAEWDRMYRLNLITVLNVCRAALPHLKASGCGSIVNVGALGALQAGAGMGPYAASKAGVHKLTEALAEETRGQGVTVNAVLPSTIDTPANRAEMGEKNVRKWVAPADLAQIMLFLTQPPAQAITGALIPVRGQV